MDYYETRASLIFYLYEMVDEDSWRLNNSLNKFRVVSYLYRTLVDVLAEFVNVRYGNLSDANEEDVREIITDSAYCSLSKFKDEKALRYIKITYFLYNNIRDLPWNIICQTKFAKLYEKENMNAKNRTIAVLKYINSIERYTNKASENIVCTIYYIYKDIIRELSPGHHVLKNVSAIRNRVLMQQDTKYVLPEKYRKLITLISFYYRPGSFFILVEMIIERSKNLFGGKL